MKCAALDNSRRLSIDKLHRTPYTVNETPYTVHTMSMHALFYLCVGQIEYLYGLVEFVTLPSLFHWSASPAHKISVVFCCIHFIHRMYAHVSPIYVCVGIIFAFSWKPIRWYASIHSYSVHLMKLLCDLFNYLFTYSVQRIYTFRANA